VSCQSKESTKIQRDKHRVERKFIESAPSAGWLNGHKNETRGEAGGTEKKVWGMNEPLNNNERRGHEFDDLSDS
jgi:hypothetical protein